VRPAPAVRSAPFVNRAAAPKWISGGLVKGDNPRGRYRGTVTVRFTVQPNGSVSGCRTAVSSGSAALDARTCQLAEQRLRFSPALNWQGRAIPYETRAIYTWGVKHRSLLDRLLKPNR
jgi:protein TonB